MRRRGSQLGRLALLSNHTERIWKTSMRVAAKIEVLVAVLAHRFEVGYVWLASRGFGEFDGKLYALAQRRKKP